MNGFGYDVGDKVIISQNSTTGYLGDHRWENGPTVKGTVIGYRDDEGLLIYLDAPHPKAWAISRRPEREKQIGPTNTTILDKNANRFWYVTRAEAVKEDEENKKGKKKEVTMRDFFQTLDTHGATSGSTGEMTDTRQTFIYLLDRLPSGCAVVGAAVRDTLAKKATTDFQLYCNSKANLQAMARSIASNWGGAVTLVSSNLENGTRIEKYEFNWKSSCSLQRKYVMELRAPESGSDSIEEYFKKNGHIDIDGLYVTADRQLRAAGQLKLDPVLENIKNRKFNKNTMKEVTAAIMSQLNGLGFNGANKMNNDNKSLSIFDRTKGETVEAAYRVGAKQLTNAVKAGIVQAMKSNGMDDGKLGALTELLDSELGHALISAGMGFIVPQIPMVGDDARAQRLCTELRIGGMETVGNLVADTVMTQLLPIVTGTLAKLPAVEAAALDKVRVSHEEDAAVVEALATEEAQAEEASKGKQASL